MDQRLVVCALFSIAGHVALGRGLAELPPREVIARPRTVEVRVVPPPAPEPPPPKAPEPPPPPPPKQAQVHEAPRKRPIAAPPTEAPRDVPPIDQPSTATDPAQPVFGVTMESTSQAGGPAVPVGNTTRPTDGPRTDAPKPLPPAAAPLEVTKMPVPLGRCSGKYTEEAKQAALEGVVVLDLIVDERGRARDITVVAGLAHGLTEAAIAALEQCTFTPGEKAGAPVPVRVRGFKIRFVLQDAG